MECPDVLGIASIDTEVLSYMFGAGLLFWCIGLGLGLMLATIRKTRL
jgi:hypothetical protein